MGSNGDHKFTTSNSPNHSGNGNSGCSSQNGSPLNGIVSQKSSISRNIKIDDLRSYFHLPIVEVAKQLGICTTLLKRVCRTNKIKKWPYRQIRSIAKSIQSIEMASMNGLQATDAEREKNQEQITYHKRSLEALIDDPSIPSKLLPIDYAYNEYLSDYSLLILHFIFISLSISLYLSLPPFSLSL